MPAAVLVQEGTAAPAREAAGGPTCRSSNCRPVRTKRRGLSGLRGQQGPDAAAGGPVRPDDVALLLHTSGTTSRPKLVPLTHADLCASAANIGQTLGLGPEDCCLNVMPLFHIHGLAAALLASLFCGASVICTGGFEAAAFFSCLELLQPTWYTAVPTIHQAVLAAAGDHAPSIARHRLRLVRSSSSALPPAVMRGLEETFGVPAVEAYGMTEACAPDVQ